MSRGPGRVQRGVLATLYADDPERWWSLTELAEHIDGTPLTRASVESVRRAVHALGNRGEVEIELFDELITVSAARVELGEGYAYRPRHDAYRATMFIRTPLSVEAKARRAQLVSQQIDRLVSIDARLDDAE